MESEQFSKSFSLNQDLLALYKIAIEEYRFAVQLGWNRQQYYLVFNSALTGFGVTLLGQQGNAKYLLAIAVFVLAFFACLMGRSAITKAHEYYRNAAYKKTLIEELLGLLQRVPEYAYSGANLGVATTAGMHSATQILKDTEAWLARPERRGSIVWYFRAFLTLLAAINILAVLIAIWLLLH